MSSNMQQTSISLPEQEFTVIRGEVKRVVFSNEDNGFCILRIELPAGTKKGVGHVGKDGYLTVKVTRPNTVEGMTLEFHGSFIKDPNYGHQFMAKVAHEVAPSTTEGLIAYLSSSHFHGIGQVKARKIIKHFGESTMDIINNDIDRLIEVAGITEKNLAVIKETWIRNKEFNEIMQFLMDHRLSTVLAHAVYDLYGKDCVSKMKSNPYELSRKIRGVGFKKADAIALSLGFAVDSPIRLKACIQYVLEASENDGHCFLYYHQIISGTEEYLGFDMSPLIKEMLSELEDDQHIVVMRSESDQDRYYGVRLYNNEQLCYRRMVELSKVQHDMDIDEVDLMNNIKHKVGIELSAQQKDAVIGILKSGVSVLTGGPGTGKCLKEGTLVLCHNGDKKPVEQIVVGDILMGNDSTPRHVLSICQGQEKMYDIVTNDGKSWGCNESHILSLLYRDSRNTIINGRKYRSGDVVNISVRDYLTLSDRKKHHLKMYSTGVEYPEIELPIDPYLFGVWLGDGSSSSDMFTITNEDKEIEIACETYSNSSGYEFVKREHKSRTQSLVIKKGHNGDSLVSVLKQLGVHSNKHIPRIYAVNSSLNRLRLLAGLIDADGYYSKRDHIYEITQKNKTLAFDIYDMAMSLGFRSSITDKIATMKRDNGSTYECLVYRIFISGDIETIPVLIERKKARKRIGNKNHLCSGFKLIDKGNGRYYGFEIDGNKLFVLGNYTVTHNTSVTKALVEALKYIGLKFVLCAPTGRAAKRMNDVINHKATTIHRLLIWDPKNHGFAHNEHMPIDADCILVDEFSMVDIHLAASLLRAVRQGAVVVFIGDPDQLPPVGAGNFFRDIINSKVIPIYTLTQIFRQGKESSIVQFSHAINKGETPIIESPLEDPTIWKEKSTDCVFIDSGFVDRSRSSRDYPVGTSMRYGYDIIGMIEHVYKETLPKYYNHPKDIQVLIPMKKGPIGTIEVNKQLQKSVNPPHAGLKELRVGDKLFRENDKVIQLTNNYDLGVVNGDIGRIVAIDHKNNQVHINYGDDRVIAYSRKDILDIDLAYAITCHKSQGSEFEYVIIPIMNQYYRMLYRQLIYTALTRAKKLAVFIGQREAMTMAINMVNSMKRQTSLCELLTGTLVIKQP